MLVKLQTLMFGKGIGTAVGLLVGILFMPWPWLVLPGIVGFALGYAWDNNTHSPEIPSEAPQSKQQLLNKHLSSPGFCPQLGPSTLKKQKALPAPPLDAPLPLLPSENELKESRLARLLCPLFIQIASSTGPVNQQKIRHIRLYFEKDLHFSEWGLSAVRAELKAWMKKSADINELLPKARPEIPPAMRLNFVSALYELAMLEGELPRAGRDLLQRVVKYLNLSEEQLQSVTSAFFGDGSAHYKVLGLMPEASDEEIKTAYRKLAVAHHPDSHAGMSSEQIQKTTETFHRVKEAYEELKKIRGF